VAVVVAVTDNRHAALQALMQAALLLPGIAATTASAADANTLNLQASRYEEDARDLPGVTGTPRPLTADTLLLSGALVLRDNIRVSFGLSQDTWSGATPVTVAPLAAGGNRPILRNGAQGVTVSGASPIVNTRIQLDSALQPAADPRTTLVMSSASPELRRQADLGFEIPLPALQPEAALTLDTSLSDEPDYRSRFGRIGGRFAMNQNLTTLNFGAALTHSDTQATLDPDLLPYLTRNAYASRLEKYGGSELLRGKRVDRSLDIGMTQVIDAASVLDAGFTLARATGFMENPYKAVTIIFTGAVPTGSGDVRAFMEQRPDEREQLAFNAHYARYFAAANATLQLDYAHSRDDWGIDTHSAEIAWAQSIGAWTLTPRLRYYTQSAADFHATWLTSRQNYRSTARDSSGREIWTSGTTDYFRVPGAGFVDAAGAAVDTNQLELSPRFNLYSAALLPANFSSDHRLAAFGSASAGLTVQRHFDRGVTLEAGLEYYTRADGLRTGGGLDSSYADFDFTMANVALTVDLGATTQRLRREHAANAHAGHTGSTQHSAHSTPAGLAFAHAGLARGSFMSGYRISHSRQQGDMLHGNASTTDAAIVANACEAAARCRFAPGSMAMTMDMLDLAYAISDSTTLMLMPQYVTTDMELRLLADAPPSVSPVHQGHQGDETSGARGDTLAAALFNAGASVQAAIGISIPTGKTNLEFRRRFQSDGGLMHYDMQTGSGTWDLLPAVTWTSTRGASQFGAQLSGIKRLEGANDEGYRLGDELQVSGWAARTLTENLSASLRAVWLRRAAIDGTATSYNAAIGPMDQPANSGGRFLDIGIGVNLAIAGSELAVEWLVPVRDDVNGFQLERDGTLAASWHYNY
jgi:hypothetical protein